LYFDMRSDLEKYLALLEVAADSKRVGVAEEGKHLQAVLTVAAVVPDAVRMMAAVGLAAVAAVAQGARDERMDPPHLR
jgi:hypothetical protein